LVACELDAHHEFPKEQGGRKIVVTDFIRSQPRHRKSQECHYGKLIIAMTTKVHYGATEHIAE